MQSLLRNQASVRGIILCLTHRKVLLQPGEEIAEEVSIRATSAGTKLLMVTFSHSNTSRIVSRIFHKVSVTEWKLKVCPHYNFERKKSRIIFLQTNIKGLRWICGLLDKLWTQNEFYLNCQIRDGLHWTLGNSWYRISLLSFLLQLCTLLMIWHLFFWYIIMYLYSAVCLMYM